MAGRGTTGVKGGAGSGQGVPTGGLGVPDEEEQPLVPPELATGQPAPGEGAPGAQQQPAAANTAGAPQPAQGTEMGGGQAEGPKPNTVNTGQEMPLLSPEMAVAGGKNVMGASGPGGGAGVRATYAGMDTDAILNTGVGATLTDQDKDLVGDTGVGTLGDTTQGDMLGGGVRDQYTEPLNIIGTGAGSRLANRNDKDIIGDTGAGTVDYMGLEETGVGGGLVAAQGPGDTVDQSGVRRRRSGGGTPLVRQGGSAIAADDIADTGVASTIDAGQSVDQNSDLMDAVGTDYDFSDPTSSAAGSRLVNQNDKDIIGDTGAGEVDRMGLDETGVGGNLVDDQAVDKGSDIVEAAGDQELVDEREAEEQAAAAEAAAAAEEEERAARNAQYDEEWEDTWNLYEQGLDDQLAGTYADEARAQRQAANMGAQMGSGVGGAFGAAAAQAQLGGMQMRQQAAAEWQQRGLEMKMAHMDKLMRRAEAANDRELQERLQQQMNDAMFEMKELEATLGADPYTLMYLDQGGFPEEWTEE